MIARAGAQVAAYPAPRGEHASVSGRVAPGNINLQARARLHVLNPFIRGHGKVYSSVYSTSVGTDRGETLIPRVIKRNGRWVVGTEQQAVDAYRRTGRHLGVYSSIAAANRAGEAIHRQQARGYGTPGAQVAAYLRRSKRG